MSAFSDYLEGKIADHIFRTASLAKPVALHIALYTTATDDAAGGTEVSGGSYARVQLNPADANWNRTGGQVSNAVAITFPAPTADWGQLTHFGVLDAATGGNRLYHGALTTAKTVNANDPAPEYAIGSLVIDHL